jgi:hypothetical protein
LAGGPHTTLKALNRRLLWCLGPLLSSIMICNDDSMLIYVPVADPQNRVSVHAHAFPLSRPQVYRFSPQLQYLVLLFLPRTLSLVLTLPAYLRYHVLLYFTCYGSTADSCFLSTSIAPVAVPASKLLLIPQGVETNSITSFVSGWIIGALNLGCLASEISASISDLGISCVLSVI